MELSYRTTVAGTKHVLSMDAKDESIAQLLVALIPISRTSSQLKHIFVLNTLRLAASAVVTERMLTTITLHMKIAANVDSLIAQSLERGWIVVE